MDPNETIAIFLEGSADLDWNVDPELENGFLAINPVTGYQFSVMRIQHSDIDSSFSLRSRDSTYQLQILVNPEADIVEKMRTSIATGDYNRVCDNLLKPLFRTAQQKAQSKLLGPDLVSTG